MNLIGYRTKIRSASQVSQDLIEQYNYLAQIIITQDNNANGEAELRFVDRNGLRQSIVVNDWTMSSQAKMLYWWGQTSVELNITSPAGVSQLKQLEIKSGSQSIYWGVETLSKVMSYFLDLSEYRSWETESKTLRLKVAKDRLNALLLEAEKIRSEISLLQNELRGLE